MNNSQQLFRNLGLFQGDHVCFELVSGQFVICERVHDKLVVLRVEDHRMDDWHPLNFRRDPIRGQVTIDHLLPVIGTAWIHLFGEDIRVQFDLM